MQALGHCSGTAAGHRCSPRLGNLPYPVRGRRGLVPHCGVGPCPTPRWERSQR